MSPIEFLSAFRDREGQKDVGKATWYVVAASALTSASAGEHVEQLYREVTAGISREDRVIVQRRMKEAIIKGSILFGVPRAAGGLGGLYRAIPEDEIDTYSPRTDKLASADDSKRREERGQNYFNHLWGVKGAQAQRERALKYSPDHYLLNIKTNYELWASEDAILSNIETQMSNVGLLICNNSPEQALWHLRGLVRHGGSLDQARFAQELGLAVAKQFDAKTGKILMVDEVDPASWALPA